MSCIHIHTLSPCVTRILKHTRSMCVHTHAHTMCTLHTLTALAYMRLTIACVHAHALATCIYTYARITQHYTYYIYTHRYSNPSEPQCVLPYSHTHKHTTHATACIICALHIHGCTTLLRASCNTREPTRAYIHTQRACSQRS